MIVELLNGLDVEGHLHGWAEIDMTESDMAGGPWTLNTPILPNNRGLLNEWLRSDLPGLAIRNPDTGYRDTGFLTEYTVDDLGVAGFGIKAKGLTFSGLLQDRATWPHPDINQSWQFQTSILTDNLDDVARAMIAEEIDPPSATYKAPPWNVEVVPNTPGALPSESVAFNMMPILGRLQEILAGTGWFVQTSYLLSDDPVPVPSLRFEVIPRPLSTAVWSTRNENVASISVTHRAATATHVIGIGEETTAPTRLVRDARNSDATWQRRYIEKLTNQPTLDAAALQNEVDRQLAASGPVTVVTATDPDPGLWGTDLRVGWLAQLAVPTVDEDYEYLQLPVTQSTLRGRAGDWNRQIEFGALRLQDLERLVFNVGQIHKNVELTMRGLN